MLRSLTVKNFAVHKKLLKIDFHKSITVITGNSDSGKSALFYALYLLIHNKPLSPKAKFSNDKLKDFKIKLILNNNNFTIVRKNKEYKLIDKDNNIQIFKAFKTEIPEPIQVLLPLKSVNWQMDYDSHFLIMESGGNIAKILAKSLGTEDQDKLLKEIKKEISNVKMDLKYQQQVKTENEKIFKKYKGIKDIYQQAQDLQKKESELQIKQRKINKLSNLLNEIQTIQDRSLNKKETEQLKIQTNSIKTKLSYYKELKLKINRLSQLLENITSIKKLNKLEIKSFTNKMKNLELQTQIVNKLKKKYEKLDSLIRRTVLLQNLQEEKNQKLKILQKQIGIFWKKNKICPTCGRNVNENHKYS